MMVAASFCSACGEALVEEGRYCASCGEAVGEVDVGSENVDVVTVVGVAVALVAAVAAAFPINAAAGWWAFVDRRGIFVGAETEWEQYLLAVMWSIGASLCIAVWAAALWFLWDRGARGAAGVAGVSGVVLVGFLVGTVGFYT